MRRRGATKESICDPISIFLPNPRQAAASLRVHNMCRVDPLYTTRVQTLKFRPTERYGSMDGWPGGRLQCKSSQGQRIIQFSCRRRRRRRCVLAKSLKGGAAQYRYNIGGVRKFKFTKHFIKINLQIQEIIYERCQRAQETQRLVAAKDQAACPNHATELGNRID